ncbi:unnamed protein product [Rhizoctonia solani]|uniref:GST N-terminal domain-containing protein n=1 Tax=Rhizoctonia solani TaxID=456999 RepID=A0A8H2XVW8_9AGAM|nr:unnamed protein product [Rhizoctonia solani]
MASETKPYILFHSLRCGSTFPLSILRLFKIPHELVVCDYDEIIEKKGPNYSRLVDANPLAQFPTLITPEGYVMTEMVAIALYLLDHYGKGTPWDIHALDPRQLAAFYRWFVFIPANIYPTITVIEFPARFVRVPVDSPVDSKTVESWITEGTFVKQGEIWNMMEYEMAKDLQDGKFLLGTEKPTFLDVLVALVAHWPPNPRYTWLEDNCPKLVKNTKETLKTEINTGGHVHSPSRSRAKPESPRKDTAHKQARSTEPRAHARAISSMSASDNTNPYTLFHAPGVGSTFPLALLRVFNVPHELVVCDYEETTARKGPNYARLVETNPLAQFPTLITPEGYVMTEMVGIALYLHDRFAKGTAWDIRGLSPARQAAFYRWFIFIPANVYPLLTIIEFPSRFLTIPADSSVDTKQVEGWVKAGTSTKREELWKMMEQEMTRELKEDTFLLGTGDPTLLDVLLSLVAHYTPHPRYSWFQENCPKLYKNVKETLKTDIIKDVFRVNELDDFL